MNDSARNYTILLLVCIALAVFVTVPLVKMQNRMEPVVQQRQQAPPTSDPLRDRFEEAIFDRAVENERLRDEQQAEHESGPLGEIIRRRANR